MARGLRAVLRRGTIRASKRFTGAGRQKACHGDCDRTQGTRRGGRAQRQSRTAFALGMGDDSSACHPLNDRSCTCCRTDRADAEPRSRLPDGPHVQFLARGQFSGLPILLYLPHLQDCAFTLQHRRPVPGLRAHRVQLGRITLHCPRLPVQHSQQPSHRRFARLIHPIPTITALNGTGPARGRPINLMRSCS